MFKRLDFVFDTPICSCDEEVSYGWKFSPERTLYLECFTCHTKLTVPSEYLNAGLVFEDFENEEETEQEECFETFYTSPKIKKHKKPIEHNFTVIKGGKKDDG
jgi:hypothetical protein